MDQEFAAGDHPSLLRDPIRSGAEYIESLRGRNLKSICSASWSPSRSTIRSSGLRSTRSRRPTTWRYAIPNSRPRLSPFTGERVNRFLHIATSPADLVMQNKMQRRLGQLTGTCFQRCVGMDALNSLHSVTYEMDEKHGTDYHQPLQATSSRGCSEPNFVIGGAMTDVKGDRSKAPIEQADPDLFVHVTRRTPTGRLPSSGAKAHQTGCLNSHWLIVMPTMRLEAADKDYAIVGALPVDAPGITYIYGRQSCDTRSAGRAASIDAGNARSAGQEAMIVFDDVFIP